MYCNRLYQKFDQRANSFVNTNIGIISKIYVKYLTITPMHFCETNG
jgi:hypothetical protein